MRAMDQESTKPLSQQCLYYITMHLEEFPVSQLSLLPVKTREELLWRLPIADLCQLEDTEFVAGIQDIAAYWKKPREGFGNAEYGVPEIEDSDIAHYVKEWNETEYARAVLYGQIVTVVIGCYGKDVWFTLPNEDLLQKQDGLMAFLYAVRNLDNGECFLKFPPRYSDHCRTNNSDIVDVIMSCFKGKFPQVFESIYLDNDYLEVSNTLKYADYFRHAVYVGIHGEFFEGNGLDFLKAVLSESSLYHNLEVLVLEGLACDLDERETLDDLCLFLSSKSAFLSKFRILKILSCNAYSHGFSICQSVFDKLITEYFSAHTDHVQKIHFRDTEVRCSSDHHPSFKIDQKYLQFKTIELDNCKFVAQATPKSISHWFGQDISVLENDEGSCTFKVKENVLSNIGRKRKFSEIVRDN